MNTSSENKECRKDLIGSAFQRHDITISTISELDESWSINQSGLDSADADELVDAACRDIDKELHAVRSRMQRLRILNEQRRIDHSATEGILNRSSKVMIENFQQDEKNRAKTNSSTDQSQRCTQNNEIVSLSSGQQEEERHEVENALSKCEMLLSQVRSSKFVSEVPQSSNTDENTEVLSDRTVRKKDGNVGWEDGQLEYCLAPQVHALETMKKLCTNETRNEIRFLHHDHISAEIGILKELRAKYESKRKILLLSLKRRLEKEAASKMNEMIAKLEVEEQSALQNLELQMLNEQDVIMQELVMKSKKKVQDNLDCTRVRLEAEIASRKFSTSKQFELEQEQKILALRDEKMQELRNWEDKLRAELEQKMINEREREAEFILRDKEERVRNIRQEIKDRHEQRHISEIEKLKRALNAGVQAQVQSMKQKYSDELVTKIEKQKEDHASALKMKLADVEKIEHEQRASKLAEVKKELNLKQRRAVEELEQQLLNHHHQELEATKLDWRAKTKELMEERQEQMQSSHEEDIARLKTSLEQDFSVELHQQEVSQAEELQAKLQQLHEKTCEQFRIRLKTKKSQIQQIHSIFLQEAENSYSISPSGNLNSNDEPDFVHSLDAYHRLKELQSGPSNEELQKCVDLFLHEFEEILEEHSLMIEKFTASTRVSLMLKKHCMMMEQEVTALRAQCTQANRLLDQKQTVCKKLYDANEALLQRLQLVPPPKNRTIDVRQGTDISGSTGLAI